MCREFSYGYENKDEYEENIHLHEDPICYIEESLFEERDLRKSLKKIQLIDYHQEKKVKDKKVTKKSTKKTKKTAKPKVAKSTKKTARKTTKKVKRTKKVGGKKGKKSAKK